MKLLHGADLHLDSPLTAAPELRQELLRIPAMLADICRREGCDAMVLSGDLFDGKWSRQSLRTLCQALEEAVVPVFISPGNHDYLSPDSPYLSEKWPENVYIFKENRITSLSVPELDLRIYGGGYQSMDCPGLLEGFRAEGEERYHVAVLHGDPTRVDSPYCPITAAQVRESGLHYLALGHVHRGGSFQAGETLCAWPGCPMGRGFDEPGAKGVLIVELEELAQARFVALELPQFHDLEGTAQELAQLLPPAGSNHRYRLTLTGEGGDEALTPLLSRFPHLELIDRRMSAADIWGSAEADSLEGAFFRILRSSDSPERELAARMARQLLDGGEVVL